MLSKCELLHAISALLAIVQPHPWNSFLSQGLCTCCILCHGSPSHAFLPGQLLLILSRINLNSLFRRSFSSPNSHLPPYAVSSESWPQYVMKCVFGMCLVRVCLPPPDHKFHEGRDLFLVPHKTPGGRHSASHTVCRQSVFGGWTREDKVTSIWGHREWGDGRVVKGPGKWGATLPLVETGRDLASVQFTECLSRLLSFAVLLSC